MDYKETFSSVIRYATIRMMLAFSVEYGLCLKQMDVCTAYFNNVLHGVVYLRQPECFVNENCPERVLRLGLAIYGMKQAGQEFDEFYFVGE